MALITKLWAAAGSSPDSTLLLAAAKRIKAQQTELRRLRKALATVEMTFPMPCPESCEAPAQAIATIGECIPKVADNGWMPVMHSV